MVTRKVAGEYVKCSLPGCRKYALEHYGGMDVCVSCKAKLELEALKLESKRITSEQLIMHKMLRQERLKNATLEIQTKTMSSMSKDVHERSFS